MMLMMRFGYKNLYIYVTSMFYLYRRRRQYCREELIITFTAAVVAVVSSNPTCTIGGEV